MKMKSAGLFILTVFLVASQVFPSEKSVTTTSPKNSIAVTFHLGANSLTFDVLYNTRPIIKDSPMQFLLHGDSIRWSDMDIGKVNRTSRQQFWKPVWGERKSMPDVYTQTDISFASQESPEMEIILQCRIYEEGFGFRYHIINYGSSDHITIDEENMHFRFTDNHISYPVPRPQAEYTGKRNLNAVDYPVEHPITIKISDICYVSLTTANVVNYSRVKFEPVVNMPYTFKTKLAGPVRGKLPFITPWRVMLIANSPGQLVENNFIIYNLNPPNKIDEPAWIRPGKAIRIATPFTTARAKRYIDFAAEQGLDYVHFDTGWYGSEFSPDADPGTVARGKVQKYPNRPDSLLVDMDLDQVVEYADENDIGVILYVNHVGLENYNLEEVFKIYEGWGIAGVKFGFVNVGPQEWMQWLHEAVRTAARHHLVVDIHDQYRPTGYSRTYPNLLTQEGIGGDETWPAPQHELILPFTRFVAGPADHTFTFYSPEMRKTHAFQLAASVVFFSPLQYLFWYDSPDEYDGNPGIKFWEQLPTTWDDTQVVHGEIGQYITIARRKGDEWFIGTINSSQPRTLLIPIDFLNPEKNYTAEVYTDDPRADPASYPVPVITKRFNVQNSDSIRLELLPGGGHAMRLTPENLY